MQGEIISTTLIVPVVLPTGSLHFAEVTAHGKAGDVVEILLAMEGLRKEVLGDLEDHGWSLQEVRAEPSGRRWEKDELLALGDGELTDVRVVVVAAYKLFRYGTSQYTCSSYHRPSCPFGGHSASFLRIPYDWALA